MPSLQIIPQRVPLTDPKTGGISREWYRFFFDQFMIVVTTSIVVEGGLRVIPGLDGEPGEDGMTIVGPAGPQGIPGLTIPGMDGADGEDFFMGIPSVSKTGTGDTYVMSQSPLLVTPLLTGYTVATLPAGTTGMMAYVTDALAPTFLGAVVGGGAVTTPVFYNGAGWVSF